MQACKSLHVLFELSYDDMKKIFIWIPEFVLKVSSTVHLFIIEDSCRIYCYIQIVKPSGASTLKKRQFGEKQLKTRNLFVHLNLLFVTKYLFCRALQRIKQTNLWFELFFFFRHFSGIVMLIQSHWNISYQWSFCHMYKYLQFTILIQISFMTKLWMNPFFWRAGAPDSNIICLDRQESVANMS